MHDLTAETDDALMGELARRGIASFKGVAFAGPIELKQTGPDVVIIGGVFLTSDITVAAPDDQAAP